MPTPAADSPPLTTLLVSVGGTPAPVLHVLRRHRPARVWYFCSEDSRAQADEIHAALDGWTCERDFIEVAQFEELGPCYRALRTALPGLLRKWRADPAEVLVDYTGGTKTMSAALVLAATEVFANFSYVGGAQRDKGGVGVTLSGHERCLYQANPWAELGVREVERAAGLWAHLDFEGAAAVLRAAAARVPHSARFEAVAVLASALAARHRLDFKAYAQAAGRFRADALRLWQGHPAEPAVQAAADSLRAHAAALGSRAEADETTLAELLDNTLRTARQHRWEDAAARLYRAMEMRGQIWLRDATDGRITNGRLNRGGGRLPDDLAGFLGIDPLRPPKEPVNLSLERVYRALDVLGHPAGRRVAADLAEGKRSRWRTATEARNASILAHGCLPVGEENFNRLRDLAADFLGLDLAAERHPLPAPAPQWLVS